MTGNSRVVILQDRDRHLLRELAVLRVIDREQAKMVAGFGSTTRANARLLALTRAGFLRRYFLGTVGGARKALYSMSLQGADLVGVPYRGPRRGRDQTLAGDFFTIHQLEINELYCIVKYKPIPADDAKCIRWLSFHEPITPDIPLIPDGYLEVQASENMLAMFLEVDLGNESRSVWRRKVQTYLAYAISGNFTKQFGRLQFRTLVVTNSERRLASLRAATSELTDRIFWFTTIDLIRRVGFWSAAWRRPTGDQRLSLL